jgi:hypothetical protein
MGGTSSKSIINNAISESLKNNASIQLDGSNNQLCTNVVNMACDNVESKFGLEINQSCDLKASVLLNQKAKIDTISANTLSNKLQAKAAAEGVNLSLNPSATSAETSVSSTIKMATEANNSIGSAAQNNARVSNFYGCTGKHLYVGTAAACGSEENKCNFSIIQHGDLGDVVNSMQDASISSNVSASLTNSVSASSSAVTKNVITSILMAIALVIAVIVIGIPLGAGMFVKKLLPVLVPLLLLLLLLFAYYTCLTKKWPCYHMCAFAPPNTKLNSSSPSYSTPTNNPCCLNSNVKEREQERHDDKDKKYMNTLCLPGPYDKRKTPQYCTPHNNELERCTNNVLKLDKSCTWLKDGKLAYGKCQTGYNTTFIRVLAAITGVSLLGATVFLYSKSSEKKKNK